MEQVNWTKLGNVCTFINGDRGVNYPKVEELVEQGIPFINAGHLQGNKIDMSNMNFITEKKYDVLSTGKATKGDVLYCLRGSLGKHAVVEFEKGAIASSLVILRPNHEKINPRYLLHVLDSKGIEVQMLRANNGSSQPNLSATSVKEFIIPLPSLHIQNSIVSILDKSEQLIDFRKKQIEACDELIKSQFIEMFGEYFRNNINTHQLKEICNFIDYRGKTPEKSDTGIPLITAKNVKSNAFSVEPQEFIPEENYDAVMVRGFPRINDVLFTTEAPLGNVCRIPDVYEKFCVGQRLITIQPNEDILTSEYVERALLSKEFQSEMWKRSSGSTVKGIRSKELVLLTIPVPPIEQQKQFTRFVQQVDKLKFKMEQSLVELENNFNSLMQRAFKGELF